jgi:hypothetical protein
MRSLLLDARPLRSVGDVARWFGAMQSQDLASGKWSFGVRLPQKTEADIDAAIERREVLRTWPMRGTIHFVPSEDAHWMLALTGGKALARARARRAVLGIEQTTANRAADVLGKALAGGTRLTRSEAIERLRDRGIQVHGQRGYHLLWYAAQMGVTCIGPNQGKEQTFVLLSDWANKPRRLSKDEALGELTLRYFRSHGPAASKDFTGWSGLSVVEAKRGLSMIEAAVTSVTSGGKTLWMDSALLDHVPEIENKTQPIVRVLPGFDEYLLGIKDRSIPVPVQHQQMIIPGNNGMFMSTMVADGVVVGTWKRAIKRTRVVIRPSPFVRLPKRERAMFDEAFAGYARYVGLECEVIWT